MADINLDWSSDDRQVQKAFNRQQRELDKLTRKLERVTGAGTQGAQKIEKSFKTLGATVSGVVGKFFGVQTALQVITQLTSKLDEVQRRAGQRGVTAAPALAELAQLAETPKEFQRLIEKAKGLRKVGAGLSLADTATTVFELESAGLGDELEFFKKLGSSGLVREIGPLSTGIAALFKTLGREETGSARDIVSKAIAAAGGSPTRAQALLLAASESGGSAKALEFSDEAILAATAITSSATGSPERGGTQVSAFLKALEKKEDAQKFVGKTFRETIKNFADADLSGLELFDVLGRQEAVAGLRNVMENLGEFDKIVADQVRAQKEDLVGRKLTLTRSSPELRAAQLKIAAEGQKEVAELDVGRARNLVDAVFDQRQAGLRKKGFGFAATAEETLFDANIPLTGISPRTVAAQGAEAVIQGSEVGLLEGAKGFAPPEVVLVLNAIQAVLERMEKKGDESRSRRDSQAGSGSPDAHTEGAGGGL